jgi:hypothetical protein
MNAETATGQAPRLRQLRLLEVENPLTGRFGAEFFRGLPRTPGVYFFYDRQDRLLYIGQSNDLRARVSSYRHVTPERHPRRTLRLVHRIARIEHRVCESAAAAVALEAALLLQHRPPFNRAGVWQPPPWWLRLESQHGMLKTELLREPAQDPNVIGPLPSGFRYVHAALFRCLLRLVRPELTLAELPLGWARDCLPRIVQIALPRGEEALIRDICAFVRREPTDLPQRLAAAALQGTDSAGLLEFWSEQTDRLATFYGKPFVRCPEPAAGQSKTGAGLDVGFLTGWEKA